MSQELSNNQRSGTPADNESKPPVVQQTTKLPSGDSVKKAPKQQGMPAIDKRVKVEHLLPFYRSLSRTLWTHAQYGRIS